ncbi:MAG: hypothetical protein K0S49_2592 [Microbacterium sp.]|nr:hypothetical protein [Microbacterium sp.]
MKANAKQLAREAESSAVFEAMARAGYVANGVIHILIGVIVIVLAAGGRGEGDQAGAMKAVAGAPAGFVVLWLIAVGLWALGVWHAAEGLLARDRSGDAKGAARKWGRRMAEWGQAAVFIALGLISAAVAMGARPNAEEAAEGASRGLLEVPGGPILLGLIGLGIGIGGLTIVGVLLVIAAVATDAETAGGLDGAVDALLALPLGPWIAWIVGVGFIAYGIFTVVRARVARM